MWMSVTPIRLGYYLEHFFCYRLESTQSIIIPELVELTNDEETSVRLAGLETITNLLSLLDDGEDINTTHEITIQLSF